MFISEMSYITLKKSFKRGTPQGGIISPLLWILKVEDYLNGIEKQGKTARKVELQDFLVFLLSGIT